MCHYIRQCTKLSTSSCSIFVSEYSEEKAKLLREIVELTDNRSQELEKFLNCLQLDRIPLNHEYLRLPRELLDCCATVVSRSNMSKDLVSAMQELDSQRYAVTEQTNEFEQLLETLEQDNDSMKSDKEYKDLQANLRTIREMLLQANESSTALQQHMTTIIEHLKILNSPLEQIEKTLPTIAELDDEINKPKLASLALLIEKVETMKKQRESLVNDFRKRIQDDDITKFVLIRRQETYKNLFFEQLKKHEKFVKIIEQNCAAQDNILHSLTEANANIVDMRTKLSTTVENRHRLIQEYINSFKLFDETLSKSNEGIEFYKKQNVKLNSLNERLKTLESQPLPKTQLNTKVASEYNTFSQDVNSPVIPDRLRLKDYLDAMKSETWSPRTANRSSMKIEETKFMQSTVPTLNANNSFHPDRIPPPPPSAGPLYSNMTEQTYTNLPAFNSNNHYQVQSLLPLPNANLTSYQKLSDNQSNIFNQNSTLFAQNFNAQPPMSYNNVNTQPFPQQQQQFYSSQAFQPQQSVYQPFLNQQLTQQPTSQNFSTRRVDLQYPFTHQDHNFSEPNRTIQQPLPPLPTKFDPYRPQPIGAYDIPTTQQTMLQPPSLIQYQDIYRPGGLLGLNQTYMPSATSMNNDRNQFVQHNPASSTSIVSSFANLSIN
ncbi:unnamed protein product [Rotaria magnacalcarata]|uniref:ALIX V-shaped domain-containing protein n=1 Tax=Rotaria magnacalcarata TaxID=392030 RepID=A0A819XNW9_9BILA|nr:unnamed protein product [Rotaria magnacalcarata]